MLRDSRGRTFIVDSGAQSLSQTVDCGRSHRGVDLKAEAGGTDGDVRPGHKESVMNISRRAITFADIFN